MSVDSMCTGIETFKYPLPIINIIGVCFPSFDILTRTTAEKAAGNSMGSRVWSRYLWNTSRRDDPTNADRRMDAISARFANGAQCTTQSNGCQLGRFKGTTREAGPPPQYGLPFHSMYTHARTQHTHTHTRAYLCVYTHLCVGTRIHYPRTPFYNNTVI